ncbi:MAG: hypothetical protein K8F25_14050, partial [Fimbriimonadaceae bacterium]|nr:hypothetical protein [Alphaproteobacteria bacterium]
AKEGDRPPEGAAGPGKFVVTPRMMSLLGCGAEELSAILREMGFRMERREALKNPSEAVEIPQNAENLSTEAATAKAESGSQSGENSEPVSKPVSKVEETAVEIPGDQAGQPVVTSDDAGASSGDPVSATTPEMIEVWSVSRPRPKQYRRALENSGKNAPRKDERARSGKTKKRASARSANKPDKPRKEHKPRPIDPDSPFAALAGLKKELSAGKNSGEKRK